MNLNRQIRVHALCLPDYSCLRLHMNLKVWISIVGFREHRLAEVTRIIFSKRAQQHGACDVPLARAVE